MKQFSSSLFFMFSIRWRLVWFIIMAAAFWLGVIQNYWPVNRELTFAAGSLFIVGLVGFVTPIYFSIAKDAIHF